MGYGWRMAAPELDPDELDELWDEFHTVVNMTSRELEDWLRAQSAGEEAEELPDEAGSDRGRHVLAVLGKRKGDLTSDDVRVMRSVVQTVREQRREDLEPTAGEAHWRHRLMTLGHDPLKPPRE
jgi:Protein of unknown function (DUF3140)